MDKKNKKSIVIGLSILFVVALIILGITYAYYRTRIIDNPNNESISVTSKKLEITYRDGSAYFISGETSVESEIAGGVKEKIEPGDSFRKEFSVENTGDGSAKFGIKIDKIDTTYTRMQDWTYTLSGGNLSEPITGTIPTSDAYIVESISIDNSEIQNYTLVITYANSSEDQSDDMGASLKFRVNIADEYEKGPSLSGGDSNTLLFALKNNFPSGEGETIPGQEASLETEARVIEVEDDYATSYVYRGNVTNNYVTYSNMCWRVVRIMGNGDIKITLADGMHSCGTANGYIDGDIDSAFVADSSQHFKYGENTNNVSDFIYKDSNVAKVLNAWAGISNDRSYTYYSPDVSIMSGTFTNTTLDKTKLSSTPNWCIDTSVYSSDEMSTIYGAYERLASVASASPSLKCASSLENESQIGILSADEVAFAGATMNSNANNYYLKTNASAYYYWTLTPSLITPGAMESIVWRVKSNGALESTYGNEYWGSIRPAVVLKSDVTLGTTEYVQDGTVDSPYVVS